MATVLLVLAAMSSGPSTRLAEMWTDRGPEDTELRWTTSVIADAFNQEESQDCRTGSGSRHP
jgi:hypothetical protein